MAGRRARTALLLTLLCGLGPLALPEPAAATPMLTSTVAGPVPGNDDELGNFWHFVHGFTNGPDALTFSTLEIVLLNPEDLGFDNAEFSNAANIVAAAEAAYPGFTFGIALWQLSNGDPLDVNAVNWSHAELEIQGQQVSIAPGKPVVLNTFISLDPGEGFTINAVAHNDFFDSGTGIDPDRIGELVIGYVFVPEPSTALLVGGGLLALVGAARRRHS